MLRLQLFLVFLELRAFLESCCPLSSLKSDPFREAPLELSLLGLSLLDGQALGTGLLVLTYFGLELIYLLLLLHRLGLGLVQQLLISLASTGTEK